VGGTVTEKQEGGLPGKLWERDRGGTQSVWRTLEKEKNRYQRMARSSGKVRRGEKRMTGVATGDTRKTRGTKDISVKKRWGKPGGTRARRVPEKGEGIEGAI